MRGCGSIPLFCAQGRTDEVAAQSAPRAAGRGKAFPIRLHRGNQGRVEIWVKAKVFVDIYFSIHYTKENLKDRRCVDV